jgi:hypothetical protein
VGMSGTIMSSEPGGTARQKIIWALVITTIGWFAVMSYASRQLSKPQCSEDEWAVKCALESPGVDVQLATSPAEFKRALSGNNAEQTNIKAMRANTYLDFVLIALYWSVFFVLAGEYQSALSRYLRWTISIAATFDILENVTLLRAFRDLERSGAATVLPRTFSLIKWAAFAVAIVFLALTTLKFSKSRAAKAIAALLFGSAGFILLGLVFGGALITVGVVVLGLPLLAAAVHYAPFAISISRTLLWIQYLYLLRFQIFAGALLALVLPAGYWLFPSIFVGLFDARAFWSLVFVAWAAVQLAWCVMVTSRLVLIYGPERFEIGDLIILRTVRVGIVVAFAALAIPVLALAWFGSLDMSPSEKFGAILIGVALAAAQLFLTALMHFSSEAPGGHTAARVFPSFGFLARRAARKQESEGENIGVGSSGRLSAWVSSLPERFSAGLLRRNRLRSGHVIAGTSLGVLLVVYVAIGFIYRPSAVSPESQPAALFYLLFLTTILTWMFSGLSFLLDALRLPVLTTVLAFSLLTGAFRTDHQFKLVHSGKQPTSTLSPAAVVDHWKAARGKAAPDAITVVATAGGGIRAAAWTARVLTGLQGSCSQSFSSSLILVSSVSGGSVGAMFFLAPFDSNGRFPTDPHSLEMINFNGSRSSLSSVGWGMLFPDLDRTAPIFGWLVPQTFDRGWALENAWITGWNQPPNISDWIQDVERGTRPAVIFNATAAENGERFLIDSTTTAGQGTIRFPENYPGWDMPVATAARLSASFTYVSPIARASDGPDPYRVHVADGGYYDNSGILSAIEWLREAAPSLQNTKILFVVIDADPKVPAPGKEWSWQRQIVAPVETLINVRTSSQEFRDDLELDMMLDTLRKTSHVNIFRAIFPFRSPTLAPLSWHLNRDQRAAIKNAWSDERNQTLVASKKTAFEVLGCPAK